VAEQLADLHRNLLTDLRERCGECAPAAAEGQRRADPAYRRGVPAQRPNPVQWIWYALGGALPRRLSPWVLADTTGRTWILRHLLRAVVQVLPLMALCLLVPPVPIAYRLSAAFGGLFIALIFSIAFMTETIEHRATKAGYPPGTAARVRTERAERDRVERRSPYRQGGSGSFD
jgi:hypothetical protein